MRSRKRYTLDRVLVTPMLSRRAAWSFAGKAVRGTEVSYAVTDTNFSARNQWEFVVRVPTDPKGRIEVRPRAAPKVKALDELPLRSLTFSPATLGTARGKWYGMAALADPTGNRSRISVRADQRAALPHWFAPLRSRMRRKAAVKPTRGTDANALVVLVNAGDHAAMIRLFFATKVWVLGEAIVL